MKKLLLKSILLLCALITGTSSSWGQITFTAGTDTGSTSVTKDGVTVSMSTMSRDDNYRTYANSDMTVTSTAGNITSVIITCTGNGTSEYGPGKFSGTNYSYSGKTGTWTGSATTVTLSASAQVRITEIVVTLAGSGSSYTITAESNNNSWGTVSLTGTTITATPASGYQVSSSTPYQVTSGNATVAQSGNAFVVTPSSDCTVRINFEAIPTYVVTITSPDNGTLSVKVGDNDVTSGDELPAGTVLRITATPNEGYNFKNIQVIDATTHTYTASNVRDYTLTASNTQIKANFEAKVYHNVNWYVNGTISSTVPVEEGTPITKPATNPDNIGIKKFMGWSEDAIDGTTNTEPTYFTSANMGTTDVNYYAVFASVVSESDDTYQKLTSDAFETSASYVIGAEQSSSNNTMWYFSSYSGTNSNISWGEMTSNPSSTAPVVFTLSGTANALVAKDNSGNYLKALTSGKFHMSTTSTTVKLNSDGTIGNISDENYHLRHNYNGGNGGLRWYNGPTGTAAYFYKVIPGTVYSNYCTTVASEPAEPVVSGSTVTLSTTANMAGWRTYNNNTSKKFAVDGTTKVYYVSGTADSKVTLTEIAGGVPANTAVILHQTSGTDITLTETDASITTPGSNLLLVSTASQNLGKVYRLGYKTSNGIGFYTYTTNSAPAGIIYLATISSSSAHEFLTLDFDEESETTAIENVNRETITNNQCFDLQGRKVAQPTKGLYIVNGKKVVIK
jgi:hypothetical protein